MSNFSGNELNKKVTLPLIAKYKNKRAELKKAIKDAAQNKDPEEVKKLQEELQKFQKERAN